MKKNQIILIIGILILIGLALGFIYWLKFIKPGAEVSIPLSEDLRKKEEEFAKIKLEYPEAKKSLPEAGEKFTTSCDKFLKVEGEISCEKAKEIALEKYPGEIYNITKVESEIDKFWVIEIQQEEKRKEVLINMEGNIIRTK